MACAGCSSMSSAPVHEGASTYGLFPCRTWFHVACWTLERLCLLCWVNSGMRIRAVGSDQGGLKTALSGTLQQQG